jgi:hypothetical protein
MRTSLSTRLLSLTVALFVLCAVLAGCGDDGSTDASATTQAPTTTASAAAEPDGPVVLLEAPAELTSAESRLIKVGEESELTYGWNKLVGSTSTDLGPFEVEMLGNVDYLSGNGPFFGFLTFTAPSGELLGLRMDGRASVDSDGVTALEAGFEVIGGTGRFVAAGGTGSMTGSRKAAVGSPIEIVVTLELTGVDS